jgi:hypothetical protein
MNENLRKTLRKLRLSGLAQSLEIRLQEAASHGLTHGEFLELILQDELAIRADRLMERRVKMGPPGVGKSFLVQALGYQAIKAGFVVYYRSVFDVVRDFLHDETFEGEDKVLARYLKPDLLLIDDMGMKQLPKRSGEFLFEIIMRRYELRSTMMTSNRPLEDWGKLIGDVPAASAILDRFLHHAELIEITGKSYRLRGRNGDARDDSPGRKGKKRSQNHQPPEEPSE